MEDFIISTDKSCMDLPMIHSFLSERSYWAKGRSTDAVKKSIENSLCFGIYNQQGQQLGFARVATDYAIFGYLMDVFVLEEFRGHGLGKKLIEYVVNHPDIKNLQRIGLATSDAHKLYRQFGFSPVSFPEKMMELVRT